MNEKKNAQIKKKENEKRGEIPLYIISLHFSTFLVCD
jgi:hypothetical protein